MVIDYVWYVRLSKHTEKADEATVAIDGKEFLRPAFRGVYGVAVRLDSGRKFKSLYDRTIDDLCKKYKLKRQFSVYKSFRVLSELGYPNGPNFIQDFFEQVKDSLEIDAYYTTIPSTKVPKVQKYGAHRTAMEQISPVEFLKELSSSYPHCCAWRYVNDHVEDTMTPIMIDHFEGELTDAWRAIRSLPNIKIFPAGDECNCYISTADFITKLIDLSLYKSRMKLYVDGISKSLPKKLRNIRFLDQLKFLAPISKEKIDISSKIAHPIVFLLKEGLYSEVVGPAKEKDVLWNSPLIARVLKMAYDLDGCAKSFDINIDQKLIRKGDIFIYLGPKGREMGKYLVKLGYEIKLIPVINVK